MKRLPPVTSVSTILVTVTAPIRHFMPDPLMPAPDSLAMPRPTDQSSTQVLTINKTVDYYLRMHVLDQVLAAPFDISLQAVSRHIQVLVRAGLVTQERTGRISRCRLDAGPILEAALWINRYSRYWQEQFDTLAMWLDATKEEDPHGLPRHDGKTGRVPQGDRRAARKDAGAAEGGRARAGGRLPLRKR